MSLLRYVSVALLLMRQKPVRAALSVLGIYIGVLSLVVILSIHEGMRRKVDDLYRTRDALVFLVQPGYDEATQRIGALTFDDINYLKDVPGVIGVLPRLLGEKKLRGDRETAQFQVLGVDEHFTRVYRVPFPEGRSFLPDETSRRHSVMVLTQTAARKLFPLGGAVGAGVSMEERPFKVIGVADWTPDISARAFLAETPGALVPSGWLVNPEAKGEVQTIEVRMEQTLPEPEALRKIQEAMTHGDEARKSLYQIQSLREFLRQEQEFGKQTLATLLAIAAVSLVVGGIGIANVMITSVTERTREIGVRKALGAKRKDILTQFLVEAAILSASGGMLAVLSAWLGIILLPSIYPLKAALAIPALPVFACLGLTILIGLVAGLYPASRAALSSAADALRYE